MASCRTAGLALLATRAHLVRLVPSLRTSDRSRRPQRGRGGRRGPDRPVLSSGRTDQDSGIADQIVPLLPKDSFVVHTSTTRGAVEWLHSSCQLAQINDSGAITLIQETTPGWAPLPIRGQNLRGVTRKPTPFGPPITITAHRHLRLPCAYSLLPMPTMTSTGSFVTFGP